jgi:hypothetical protein
MSELLGTVFYSILMFATGALVGPPFFGWLKNKMPWSDS